MTPEVITALLNMGPTGIMVVALGFMLRYLMKFYNEVRDAEKARTDALMTQVTAHLAMAGQVVQGLQAVVVEAREMIRDIGDHQDMFHNGKAKQ